jgi:type IV pilus assembly protein PilW
MIEGIEGFRVEFGIDNVSDAGTNIITGADSFGTIAPANLQSAAINWAVTTPVNTSPANRGDGSPDGAYKRCTTATPCTAAELRNVVTARLYVLVRSETLTPGYNDVKTYNLGSSSLGPYNDGFKRQLFTQTIRLINISMRRETP